MALRFAAYRYLRCISGIFILLILWSFNSSAQPKNLIVSNISTDHGLSGEDVRVIPDNSYNFIWFGVDHAGFCCYNTSSFILFSNNPDIKRPYLQTFGFCFFVLLVIAIFIFVHYSSQKIKRSKLEKLVNERTNELKLSNEKFYRITNEMAAQNIEIYEQKEEIAQQKLELEKTIENLRIISEFGQELNNLLSFKDINYMMYKYINWMMNCSVFGIGLYNDTLKTINFPHFFEGKKTYNFDITIDNPDSCAAYAVRNQKVIFSNDFEKDYKKYMNNLLYLTEGATKSIIYIPLIVKKKKIGVVTVQNYEENAFSDNDVTNLRSLASFISIALDNADAYEKLQKQNTELEKHRNNLEQIITERTDDLRKAMVKAEESDRLKSAFLANLSHEIRTPLNAIIGFSSLLVNDDNDNEIPKEEIYNVIQNNSNALLNIINDIVDFSLIEAGQVKIIKENFSLTSFLNELNLQFKEEIKRINEHDGRNLEFHIKSQILENDLFINTDPYKLRQVLTNLFNNAIKFTNSGTIEAGYEIIEREIRFFVSDTGSGIDEKNLNFIFERFWKDEISDNTIIRGTGLGLTITKNLLELMDGKIYVISEKGKGSTFYFTLPFTNLPVNKKYIKKEIKYSSNPDWSEKTILIVEDVDSNFAVLDNILKKTGACIIRATHGKEAIDIFSKNNSINLILMDIRLPVMNGQQATKEIKKLNKNITIIAQTAHALSTDESYFLKSGFDGYISKPFIPEKIIQILSEYLN